MGMRRRCGPPGVLVGHSAAEALKHLERDASLAVRVRWALDADTAHSLHALLAGDKGTRSVRSAFVDSFYGADDMPAAGRWLRCREITSDPCIGGAVGGLVASSEEAGATRVWCMRVSRCVGNGGQDGEPSVDDDDGGDGDLFGSTKHDVGVESDADTGRDGTNDGKRQRAAAPTSRMNATYASQRRRRRIYVHSDECDDTRLLRVVAPDSAAADLSDLALGLYARIVVQRVVFKDVAPMAQMDIGALPSPSTLRITIDTMDLKGGYGRTLVQGSAVVGDAQSASRLVALLSAAGADPTAPPPPSKVVAYLARRRPVLCARLIKRGAVDEASFDTL
nr:hypothetical protein [Pandoravirus aubagnensis]